MEMVSKPMLTHTRTHPALLGPITGSLEDWLVGLGAGTQEAGWILFFPERALWVSKSDTRRGRRIPFPNNLSSEPQIRI